MIASQAGAGPIAGLGTRADSTSSRTTFWLMVGDESAQRAAEQAEPRRVRPMV